jgi:hypothetical protein
MASIHRDIQIACDADQAWDKLREFGAAARLFPGVLTDCREDSGVRTVTFANGMTVQERLVTRDDAQRRLVYAVLNGSFMHHSAAMQIIPAPPGARFVWTSDFLPDEAASSVEPLVDAGCTAIKHVLENP